MIFVSDLMTVNPITITPDTPLRHVLATMKGAGCRQLPVLKDGVLVGIITDRDVRQAANVPALDPAYMERVDALDEHLVRDYMTADPLTVPPIMPMARAAELLSIYKFGALPVVEEAVLVGIVSVTDFLNFLAAQSESEPYLVT